MKTIFSAALPLTLILATSGCDQFSQRLGLEDPLKKEARQEAEGKAVGSACRQSGRAIEDCYSVYYWLPKAPIFAGWREMNDYMLENKLEIVQPKLEPPLSPEELRKRKKKEKAAQEAEGVAETPQPAEGAKPEPKPAEKTGT